MWRLLNPSCDGLVLPYVGGRRVLGIACVRARGLDTNLCTVNSNIVFVISVVVRVVIIVTAIIVIITIIIITFVSVIRVAL
jgi:hypothetical protein